MVKERKLKNRTFLLIGLALMLPIIFTLYSPVIMATGILNGVITLSALVFILWFILSLFFGRAASCGYTCPYGALQEIFGYRVLNKKPKKGRADYLRYIIFATFLGLVIYTLLNRGLFNGMDLYASSAQYSVLGFRIELMILIPLSILVIGTFSIVFGSRAFCRYLCPQGVFLTIGDKMGKKIRINRLHIYSDSSKCGNCKICDKSCPMGIEVEQKVTENSMEDANCIMCGECASACPKDAINYQIGEKVDKPQSIVDLKEQHEERYETRI